MPDTTVVYPADVVLFEGILVFYNQDIRDMFHLRLFVDTDSDVRLSRRGTPPVGRCSAGPPPSVPAVRLRVLIFPFQFCET